jgi:hypothetical protein
MKKKLAAANKRIAELEKFLLIEPFVQVGEDEWQCCGCDNPDGMMVHQETCPFASQEAEE